MNHPASLVVAATLAMIPGITRPQSADPGAPPPPRVQSAGGIEYLSGGAGQEARAAIASMQAPFPMRIVFSEGSGEYIVVDHVAISAGSRRVLEVDGVGPMLLVKLPQGDYTVEATYGGRTERRTVRVGRERLSLNWRWSSAADATAPR